MPAASPRVFSLALIVALAGGAAGGGWWLWKSNDAPHDETPSVYRDEALAGDSARTSRKRAAPQPLAPAQGGAAGVPSEQATPGASYGEAPPATAANASGATSPADTPTIRVVDAGEELLPRDAAGRPVAVAQEERTPGLRPLSPTPAPTATPGTAAGAGGNDVTPAAPPPAAAAEARPADPAIARAISAYESGRVIEARGELNRLLAQGIAEPEAAVVRHWLARIADETIFSRAARGDDPLVESHTIGRGERLAAIARRFNVPPDFILYVNGISSPNAIKAGQSLRIPRGPVNLRICRSQFRMDVYVGDTYVRSYPVALGADPGTPLGVWRVGEKLVSPTYYPPPSAKDKRVIPGGRPDNPLGSHWIRIEGVEGEAVGKTGYGIHGTIEPDSIGKAASLGCVRMHNADVAVIYKMLLPGKSRVTIVE